MRGNPFNIEVPAEGFTDPLQAIKFFYNALAENGKKPVAIYKESKEDKKEGRGSFMTEVAKHETLDAYLAESKGDRMSGLNMFLEPSGEMTSFMSNAGMKTADDYQNDMTRVIYTLSTSLREVRTERFLLKMVITLPTLQTSRVKH